MSPIKRGLFVALTIASDAHAQRLSFGVIGGAGLTDGFQSSTIPAVNYSPYYAFYPVSKDYVAGAMIELSLPLHLSVEGDAMYRPLNYAYAFSYTNPSGQGGSVHPSATVITWEFPVLAKYKIPMHVVKPFFEAGPAFRAASNLNATSPSNHGVSAGGGIEVAFHRLKITPQFRYTRWAADRLSKPWALTDPNQAEFLVGFSL
jgi:hypothetical protein